MMIENGVKWEEMTKMKWEVYFSIINPFSNENFELIDDQVNSTDHLPSVRPSAACCCVRLLSSNAAAIKVSAVSADPVERADAMPESWSSARC